MPTTANKTSNETTEREARVMELRRRYRDGTLLKPIDPNDPGLDRLLKDVAPEGQNLGRT